MSISADLRQGWREFRSRPWVSAIAVVTLALGVGGAITMFTMVKGIGLAMIPFGVDGARVGRIVWTDSIESGARGPVTGEEYVQLAANVPAIEALSASADRRLILGGEAGPTLSAKEVTVQFFTTFGCRPSAGRLFGGDEARAAARVAVVSEALLKRQPDLAPGKVARLGIDDYTVIGVVPNACWFPTPGGTDVWLPMPLSATGVPTPPQVWATGRLCANASPDLAHAQILAVGQRLLQHPPAGSKRMLRLITLKEDADKRLRLGAVALLGPSLVVLLIACGNVANLLLARAARREREMAIRASLGAGRLRLMRERLVESAWIGVAGGLLGLALAFLGVRLMRVWMGSFESSRTAADIFRLDGRALLFAVLVTLAIPMVFGLVPALATSKPNLSQALHQAPGRKRPRRGPYGGRDLLVIVEIGLAVVLVVTTGMFVRFFGELDRIDWGYDPGRVLAVQLAFDNRSERQAGSTALLVRMVEAVEHLPGVQAAATGSSAPGVLGSGGDSIEFEGCVSIVGTRTAAVLTVGPDYFAAVGLPVRRGRAITAQDAAGAPPVGVISESYGSRCWPGRDPIGRRFRQQHGRETAWVTIVGVVPDIMRTRLSPDGAQSVYVPYAQRDGMPDTLLVRAAGDPAALAKAVRTAIRQVDPMQPLDIVERLDESFYQRLSTVSMMVGLIGGFGIFALSLGALGVFSVMSYTVAERTREFGIRIALGASRGGVLLLVLRHALVIVAIGSAVSATGTLAVTRTTFREMADLVVADPTLWMSVTALLALVAFGASIVPAWRATRVEPVVALRAE